MGYLTRNIKKRTYIDKNKDEHKCANYDTMYSKTQAYTNLKAIANDVSCFVLEALMRLVRWPCHASQCVLQSAHQAIQRQWGCLAGLWVCYILQTVNKVS